MKYFICIIFIIFISCQSGNENRFQEPSRDLEEEFHPNKQLELEEFIISHKQTWNTIDEADLRKFKEYREIYRIHIDSSFTRYNYLVKFMVSTSNVFFVEYKKYIDYSDPLYQDSLIYFNRYQIEKDDWEKLISIINKINFWELESDKYTYYDGIIYEIEGFKKEGNDYHFVKRNLDTINDFSEACLNIVDLIGR